MMKRILLLLSSALILLSSGSGYAQESALKGVPPELLPWIEWIKEKHPDWACARLHNEFECTWPGKLTYKIFNKGATFVASVELQAEGEIPLPGRQALFPKNIEIRSDTGPVYAKLIQKQNELIAKLPRGRFTITGTFTWDEMPHELPAPSTFGILDVESSPELGPLRAQRVSEGFLLIDPSQESPTNSLTVRVLRGFSDGSPLVVETRLLFRVSGTARSVQIGRVLPENAVPVGITSTIPFQLQQDGLLSVQVGQGEYMVTIRAVLPQPAHTIKLPNPSLEEWPPEETLVWNADPAFRTVEVSGASAVSADLANIPAEWSNGAVYVAKRGAQIDLKELSRGEQTIAPDDITLNRTMWIDLDGSGFTVRDHFSGILNSSARLESLPETKLGRATSGSVPLLIAKAQGSDLTGVELRSTNLELEAVSRLEKTRTVSAVGWNTAIQNLAIELQLPPSWTLIDVIGARAVSGSWVGSWTLLDIFLSILVVVAAFQLFGGTVALVTALALFLFHGEFLAPRMLLVHLLICAVWCRLVTSKEGIWRLLSRSALITTFAAWSLQLLSFVKLQCIQVLYPQLQSGTRYRTVLQEILFLIEGSFLMWPYLLTFLILAIVALRSIVNATSLRNRIFRVIGWGIAGIFLVPLWGAIFFGGGAMLNGSDYDDTYQAASAPSSALPQYSRAYKAAKGESFDVKSKAANTAFSYEEKVFLAGPALPEWNWKQHTIMMDAPIGPDSTISFVFLSPFLTRMINLIRSLIALVLIGVIFRALGFSLQSVRQMVRTQHISPVSPALVLLALLPFSTAQADIPNSQILGELEKRIEQSLCNANQCATIAELNLSASGQDFSLQLDVSSHGEAAVIVPGPLSVLQPYDIELNGKTWGGIRRTQGDFLAVRTPAGRSKITIKGRFLEQTSFTLQIPQKPVHGSITSHDWHIEGADSQGTIESTVRFTAKTAGDASLGVLTSKRSELPSWFVVERDISITDVISVRTTIKRIGSKERATTVALAQLPNERITSDGVRLDAGRIIVSIPSGQEAVSFSSTIPYAQELSLEAAASDSVSYEWLVTCAPFVHCDATGLGVTQSTIRNQRIFRWLPFPGEKAVVSVEQLKGIAGDFITIDGVKHLVRWGSNILEGTVEVRVRATQQQSITITLPNEAVLRSSTLDGNTAGSANGGETSVLLNPGPHVVHVGYSLPWQPSLNNAAPPIVLSSKAHNVSIEIEPSQDRWILWTGGLPWGPGVVFWSKLIFIVSLVLALRWLGLVPVSWFGAIFLGTGLAALPLYLLLIPFTWLIILETHENLIPYARRFPVWLRIGSFVGLTVLAAAVFYRIVQLGLVLTPPMLIAGNQSSATLLRWFTDHSPGELPQPWVLSLPMWCWRAFALIWSTWLVISMLRWLRRTVVIIKENLK